MIPFIKVEIPTPANNSLFLGGHTESNLINDVKSICYDLNLVINNISSQKERVKQLLR